MDVLTQQSFGCAVDACKTSPGPTDFPPPPMEDARLGPALATRTAALLPAERSSPLLVALTLLRLGSESPSLLASAISKLRNAAPSLSEETRRQLELELRISLPPSIFPALPSTRKHGRSVSPPMNLPLSSCASLWTRTRSFYSEKGADAFSSGIVPSHISTSAFLGCAYARVIERMLHDVGSNFGGVSDEEEPVYIIDVGCGCGVLGVRVALELAKCGLHLQRPFCVVLADLDPTAALAQAALPSAAALVRNGQLDVAQFDADASGSVLASWAESRHAPPPSLRPPNLRLLLSGRILPPRRRQPLIVLASYLFDSLPIDVLRLPSGRHDTTPEVLTPIATSGRRGGIRTRFAYAPSAGCGGEEADGVNSVSAGSGDARVDELCARLLELASDDAEARGVAAAAIVPVGAARCVWWLYEWLAGGRTEGVTECTRTEQHPPMLLLIGDKIIDRHSAARLVAAERPNGHPPMELSELKLFDEHGGEGGPISTSLVLEGVLEAMRLCTHTVAAEETPAVDGEAVRTRPAAPQAHARSQVQVQTIGRSPAMMEFDVCAFLLASTSAADVHASAGATLRATRDEFGKRLGKFGPAELERLCAFVYAESTSPTGAERVPLRLLVDVLVLTNYDWPTFHEWRWLVRARLRDAPPDDAASAIAVARRCFETRVVLDATAWAASELTFGRWLCAAGEWSLALHAINAYPIVEGRSLPAAAAECAPADQAKGAAAERAFLAGVCHYRLGELTVAERLLRDAAQSGHRGAARRMRHVGKRTQLNSCCSNATKMHPAL